MADPLHQFQIQKVIDLPDVTLPVFGYTDLAITNSHIAMTVAFVAIILFLQFVTSGAKVVPGKLQAAGESLFDMIDGVTDSIIGHDGRKYFPFVFALFLLVLAMNLLGMFLSFTATSQLAVTVTFALLTILLVIGIGFLKNGLGFFKLFWPASAPLVLRPVVGAIEFLSFLLRPVTLATSGAKVVPGRLQTAGETLFGMIDGLTESIIGHDGKKYFPFVFAIFTFILAMNLLGMFLSFTATSQLAVTATFAALTFGLVLILGFAKNGLGFFKLFWPMGAPIVLRPIVGFIELISFMLRPFTLMLRLFGNMLGGHVALKVFAGFVATAVIGGAGYMGVLIAPLSMGMTVALTALEFLVAFLQAFVFAVLTCIYLNDVVNLDHAH